MYRIYGLWRNKKNVRSKAAKRYGNTKESNDKGTQPKTTDMVQRHVMTTRKSIKVVFGNDEHIKERNSESRLHMTAFIAKTRLFKYTENFTTKK